MKIILERGRDDIEPTVLGPFDWVQITYDTVRIPPDGETILIMGKDKDWYPVKIEKLDEYWSSLEANTDSPCKWSDVILAP